MDEPRVGSSPMPPDPPVRSPTWMGVLLVVSLALNLLVAGMIGGAVLSGGGPGAPREAMRDLASSPFLRALAPEDRRALLRGLRDEREALRANRTALRDRFQRLLEALRAEELDAAELARLLEEQRVAGEARQRLGERLVLDRVTRMSLPQRRAYAERLEAEVRRPRPR